MHIVDKYLDKKDEICEFIASIIPELTVVHGTYRDSSHLSPNPDPKSHTWLEYVDTNLDARIIIDPMTKYIGNNGILKNYKANIIETEIERVNKFVSKLDYSFVPPDSRDCWERLKLQEAGLLDDGEWFKFKFKHRVYITDVSTSYWCNDLNSVVALATKIIKGLNANEKLTIDIECNENKEDLSYIIVNMIRKLIYDGVITKEKFEDSITVIGSPVTLNIRSLAFEFK